MDRASLSLLVALACTIPMLLSPSSASAQEEEARILFEQGNEHLARGMRGPARRRAAALSEAVDAYLGVLRLGARTRNVIFNLGLASERLERHNDAFNYYAEYLRSFDLTADERAEGTRRLTAVRSEVAVLSIRSTPEGADVRIDRNDLPVRGQTPLELALPEGAHTVLLTHRGYRASSTPSIDRRRSITRSTSA